MNPQSVLERHWLHGRAFAQRVSVVNSVIITSYLYDTYTNCCKSLAPVRHRSIDDFCGVHLQVLLENVPRAKKVGINQPQPCFLPHIGDVEWIGHNSDKK